MISIDSDSVLSDCTSSTTASSERSSPALLCSDEDDPLIPSAADIKRTYHVGKATWAFFLQEALNMPQGLWPTKLLDPYIALSQVPALPSELPRSNVLHGRPRWHLRQRARGIKYPETSVSGNEWDPALVSGRRVTFCLGHQDSLRCGISPQAAACYLGTSSMTMNSIAVLTLCWSYVLSTRFLELQGKLVQYSTHRLRPQRGSKPHQPTLYLDGASPALVRWLCAILCPGLGWSAPGKLLPPWAASIDANVGIAVSAPASAEGTLAAPNSSEAIELLLELCRLCGLGTEADQNDQDWTALPPYKAGFFAALMLPFYRFTGLRPQFPPPHLSTKDAAGFDDNIDQAATRRLAQGLRYFMTLSLHPPSLGSILWSIFWQPDIECNLVSPWLAAIIDTLDPTIHAKRAEILVKTFASRRPKVAFWWLALCLLGDVSVLDWIRRYAQTQSEQYGYGSLSPPDPMVSAWVGSKQSFLDFDKTSCYTGPSDLVTRADLLRCRFDCKLQDSASTTLSWRPFGHTSKQCIEPDLWPSLEADYVREYSTFTWYLGKQRRATSLGYQRESGRAIEEVRDMVEVRLPGDKCQAPCRHDIKLAPSKEATLNMLSLLVEDASGTRHWANAAVLLQNLHPWMRDWEGLDTMEIPDRRAPDADDTPKRPSWFLQEWIEGMHEGNE
ncbi:hypothetical protein VFPFJ_11331 [Purpureocillium lilacinum]|uniref:Uncharacterized protein n=1 Tax=Purpureocillium lilacinum TaxID=33203 RepID=A0A179FF04_PURLI|nr:hypothetical protein VFPFJ_11331 [Purpureocillium lilacinum]OAQ63870.1 hypothetical protein VFPFJ_11331 [Purpureocillium lilacinum]